MSRTTTATTRRATPSPTSTAKALFELGDAAAHATLTLALSKTGLFPDGSRQAQVKVTGKAAKGEFAARQLTNQVTLQMQRLGTAVPGLLALRAATISARLA